VLAIGGVLGLLSAVSMLLVTLVEFGASRAALSITERLPTWAQLSAAPPAQISMLIAGFLCALLLVAGSWPIKVFAGLSAAWFVYAQGAFGSGSHWAQQMEAGFDFTPFRVGGLVGVIALLAISVLALVIAVRPTSVAARRPSR
jgi:uncharacterized membrane protein